MLVTVHLSNTGEDGIGLCDWKIDRSKCHTAIYNHKNIFFNKRVNTYIGKGKSKQSVNLLVKLYPDGLDGDRGSSATLTVDVIGENALVFGVGIAKQSNFHRYHMHGWWFFLGRPLSLDTYVRMLTCAHMHTHPHTHTHTHTHTQGCRIVKQTMLLNALSEE